MGLSPNGKIDLCRGLLAWLVVVCHAFIVTTTVHPGVASSLRPSDLALLDHTVGAGFVWVMGFFVLSGYCIHQSVARRLDAPSFPLKAYLVARLTRIAPLYYAALAFAAVAEPWISTTRLGIPYPGLDGQGLLAQTFFLQNVTHCFGSFTPSWSLTNEVFYYLVYGLLVAGLGHRRILPFAVGLGVCTILGSAFQGAYLAGFKHPMVTKFGLLFGLGFNWFLGVGVAVYRERLRASRLAQGVARSWPLVLTLGFAGYHLGLTIQFAYLCSGLAFSLLLIRIVAVPQPVGGIAEPPWATRMVRFAGLTSYPTYLFHFTLMWLMASAMMASTPGVGWLAMIWILVAASLVVGAALGWVAERPIMQWRAGYLATVERRNPSPVFPGPAVGGGYRLRKESA